MTGPIDVLIVEDTIEAAEGLKLLLAAKGYRAHVAADLASARRMVLFLAPNAVLLDLNLGGEKGADLIPFVREHRPSARVVVLSGEPGAESTPGADGALVKGQVSYDEFIAELPRPRGAEEA